MAAMFEDSQRWVEMELLVTVKAYPSVSTKYGEAICVAGVRLDIAAPEWVRLFPVPYRDLPEHQQFEKYQLIRLRARRHSTDARRETWRPDVDSIQCGEKLPPGGPWTARRVVVEPLLGPTACELMRSRTGGGSGPSLGLIRPNRVLGVRVSRETEWSPGQRSALGQGNLLTSKSTLEKPGHSFSYRYQCEEPDCKGHSQKIVDWELGEAYRSWPGTGDQLVEAIRCKWHDVMCAEHRETFFFIGDQHKRPGKFLVLGTFYPERRPNENQLVLDVGGRLELRGALLAGSDNGA
jgi:hypothetical protein